MALSGEAQRRPVRRGRAAPDAAAEASLGYWLRDAHRAFVRALAQELAPHGILPAQWTVLRALWHRDGVTQVELAERIGGENLAELTRALSQVVDALQ